MNRHTRHVFDPNNPPTIADRALLADAAASVRVMRADAMLAREDFVETLLLREERTPLAQTDAPRIAQKIGDPRANDPDFAALARAARGGADPLELSGDFLRELLEDYLAALDDGEQDREDVLERAEDAPCVCYAGKGALRGTCECTRTGWRKSNHGDGGVRAYSIPCDPNRADAFGTAEAKIDDEGDDPVTRAIAARDHYAATAWQRKDGQ